MQWSLLITIDINMCFKIIFTYFLSSYFQPSTFSWPDMCAFDSFYSGLYNTLHIASLHLTEHHSAWIKLIRFHWRNSVKKRDCLFLGFIFIQQNSLLSITSSTQTLSQITPSAWSLPGPSKLLSPISWHQTLIHDPCLYPVFLPANQNHSMLFTNPCHHLQNQCI